MSLPALGLAFLVAAIVTWVAGLRLAREAKVLAAFPGVGQATVGEVLLGILVSLPELTMSAVAAAMGQRELALNSLLGGVAMTMLVLAATDLAVGREPLSRDVRHPVILLEAAVTLLLVLGVAGGMVAGDVALPGLGVGAATTLVFGGWIVGLWAVRRVQQHPHWRSDGPPAPEEPAPAGHAALRRTIGWLVVSGGAVVAAGTVLAVTADRMAEALRLGDALVGFLLGGIATTLPELGTTIEATRQRQVEMAFSDAFGTNQCSLALLFMADLVAPGAPLLLAADRFALFAVVLGGLLTAVYLAGLVVRQQAGVLRMGVDSWVVAVAGALGLLLLSRLA